nr:MAG TPA: hypothetical protein [Caudoviricetes sp.]
MASTWTTNSRNKTTNRSAKNAPVLSYFPQNALAIAA